MFRSGIAVSKIKCIACDTKSRALRVIEVLREAGITQINGKPIEEIVYVAPYLTDLIKIGYGETTETIKTAKQIMEENKDPQERDII